MYEDEGIHCIPEFEWLYIQGHKQEFIRFIQAYFTLDAKKKAGERWVYKGVECWIAEIPDALMPCVTYEWVEGSRIMKAVFDWKKWLLHCEQSQDPDEYHQKVGLALLMPEPEDYLFDEYYV